MRLHQLEGFFHTALAGGYTRAAAIWVRFGLMVRPEVRHTVVSALAALLRARPILA